MFVSTYEAYLIIAVNNLHESWPRCAPRRLCEFCLECDLPRSGVGTNYIYTSTAMWTARISSPLTEPWGNVRGRSAWLPETTQRRPKRGMCWSTSWTWVLAGCCLPQHVSPIERWIDQRTAWSSANRVVTAPSTAGLMDAGFGRSCRSFQMGETPKPPPRKRQGAGLFV